MEYIKVSAKTVEDAIIEASIQLGTSSDNIEYEVLDAGSSGFLGLIGGKPAVIQARRKQEELNLDTVEDVVKKTAPEASKEKPKQKPKAKEPREAKKEVKREPKKEAKPEQTEKQSTPVVAEKTQKKPALSVQDKEASVDRAKKFLDEMLRAMGMEVEITASFDEEDNLNIELAGKDMGVLIGKRGQTLDSIQYLVSLVVNKEISGYIRVKVDTENYRIRRKETLENLARNIASKVKRTRKPVFLEPMNPYERRIIHSALQSDPYVSTHSEGEEPYRKVVVTLKK